MLRTDHQRAAHPPRPALSPVHSMFFFFERDSLASTTLTKVHFHPTTDLQLFL